MPSSSKLINEKCEKCGKTYQIMYKRTLERKRSNRPNLCQECMKKYQSELVKNRYRNMTKDEYEKLCKNRKQQTQQYWDNISAEERKQRSDALKKYINSLSDEALKQRMEAVINGNREYWDNLSQIERESLKDIRIKRLQQFLQEMKNNDQIRQKFSEKISLKKKEFWESKSPDEKGLLLIAIQEGHDNWNKSLTEDEKAVWIANIRKAWANKSDDDMQKISMRMHNTSKEYWDNLTIDEKILKIRNVIVKSQGKNGLSTKFEKMFNNSILINNFYLQEEIGIKYEISHLWDYGVYSRVDNSLVMVIDLDGAYFHADICDYDGFHSQEEYDEKRYLSVPEGIKSFIIQEYQLKKSFELMMKQLMMDYDEYIQDVFNTCRMMSFPYPRYSEKELVKSYNTLCKMNCDDKYHQDISLNTRIGDMIIMHFHHSIYHAHVKGKPSPYDAWYNDDLLMRCIQNRVIYQSYLNPNKILQGFNISKIATKVSVFSAGRAKMIIHKYLLEYNEVFDPFSGFSGRMLGSRACKKRYIGQDINKIHVKESNEIINFLSLQDASIIQQDILTSYGEYECLFTCPPYEDKEIWEGDICNNRSCDEWIDICLMHYKCRRYVFVVDKTKKYQDYIKEEIINKSHFCSNSEYLIVIDR